VSCRHPSHGWEPRRRPRRDRRCHGCRSDRGSAPAEGRPLVAEINPEW